MISQDVVTVNHRFGLHAQTATTFLVVANQFESTIWIEKGDHRANAKSLLGIISLGIVQGTTISLIADGTDAETAVAELKELIETGLDNI